MLANHSVDAVDRLDSWDAERRELLVLACMDCLWTARDTTEWYSKDRRSSYDLGDLNRFVERYGPDLKDKESYWRGFEINLDDLSSRTVLYNYKGEEVDPETVPARDITSSEAGPSSSAPRMRDSPANAEDQSKSPSPCSFPSVRSAMGCDCCHDYVVVASASDARDANNEGHLLANPGETAPSGAVVE